LGVQADHTILTVAITAVLALYAFVGGFVAMNYECPGGHPVDLGTGLSWVCIGLTSRVTGRRFGNAALREGP
jgi:hypothetical protein